MSVKRAKKVQKRNKKKLQVRKQRSLHTGSMVGRLDSRVTSPEDMMLTMFSPDVPESEWHPNDVAVIRERIQSMSESMEGGASVKRRPDGSFTVISDPEAFGFDDKEPDDSPSDVMPDAFRATLLDHLRTVDQPRSIVLGLSSDEVLFMQTAEQTVYSVVSKGNFAQLVPEHEHDALLTYLKEHKDQRVVGFQEDDSPLMTFVFDDDEILLYSPPEKNAVFASQNSDMRVVAEAIHGDNPDEFCLVELVNEADHGDCSAIGMQLDKTEWETLVIERELIQDGYSYEGE